MTLPRAAHYEVHWATPRTEAEMGKGSAESPSAG